MSWAGSANIQDGVTIDLSQMKSVAVNDETTITRVEPGARWSDVYSKLSPMNLSVVGGRVSDVGVAGLTLGGTVYQLFPSGCSLVHACLGGNSFFAPQYGFACDGVANFEVVLASGRIVNANLHSHRDLFRALKGGNNNFGIVTRFDFKTFSKGQVWGGFIIYPFQTLQSQVQALQDFTTASGAGTDPYASVINAYVFGTTGPEFIANQYTYTKPQPYPEILQNFTNLQPQISNSMRIADLLNITDEVGAGTPNGYRYVFSLRSPYVIPPAYRVSRQLFGTATIGNNASLLSQVLAIAQQVFQPLKNVTDFQSSVVFQPIPRTITNKGITNGGNSLGLDGTEDLICELFRLCFRPLTKVSPLHIPTKGINEGHANPGSFQSSISQSNGLLPKMIPLSILEPSRSCAKALRSPSPRTFTTTFCISITLCSLKTQLPGMGSGISSS